MNHVIAAYALALGGLAGKAHRVASLALGRLRTLDLAMVVLT